MVTLIRFGNPLSVFYVDPARNAGLIVHYWIKMLPKRFISVSFIVRGSWSNWIRQQIHSSRIS